MQQRMQNITWLRMLILLITLAVLALAAITWIFIVPTLTGNLYIGNRQATRNELNALIDTFKGGGAIDDQDSGLVDNECDNSASVDSRVNIVCSFSASKLFKNKGNLQNDMRQADELLMKMGFSKVIPDDPYHPMTEYYDKASSQTIIYQKSSPIRIRATLTYDASRDRLSELLAKYPYGLDSSWWHDFDYFYGIKMTSEYYSCTSTMLEPCLLVPAPLNSQPKPRGGG